jgi:hypothetical protein
MELPSASGERMLLGHRPRIGEVEPFRVSDGDCPDVRRSTAALVLIAALSSACASGAPTPMIVYVTPAPPTATLAPTPTPTPAPTPSPTPRPKAAQLEIVPCTVGVKKTCRREYNITDFPKTGAVVNLTWTVRNVGLKASGPISAAFLSCDPMGACYKPPYSQSGQSVGDPSATTFWLPDKFTLLGCSPSCAGKVVNDRTGWELQWAGNVGPGKTASLAVTFRADGDWGYYYFSAALFATSLATYNAGLFKPGTLDAVKIGEWDEIQVLVAP